MYNRAKENAMRRHTDRRRSIGAEIPWRETWVLAAFVAACLGIGALGAVATASSVGTWYRDLNKPAFTPPAWVFGPVWTLLYVMIAVAGWRVWRVRDTGGRKAALTVYAAQLALNLAWSFVFFRARMIAAAFADIVLLLAAVVVSLGLFWRVDRLAGSLLVPYALWVAFATVLNFALWRLN
jgi:benzodiazapine receptor